jgi:hypothetical protein
MYDYIKNNSNRCVKEKKCACARFQSYNRVTFGENIKICSPQSCLLKKICNKNEYQFRQYVSKQQDLYALMRRRPELFPIISSVKEINLTIPQQRAYSNLWYRQFGTSQALPVNDNWGGFYLPGSEVPFTD